MKFGFDIDGTITAAPAAFAAIMLALRQAGHECWVITGVVGSAGDENARRAQLAAVGVSPACFDGLRIFATNDGPVAAQKAAFCRNEGIDFVFENEPSYAEAIIKACPVTVMATC